MYAFAKSQHLWRQGVEWEVIRTHGEHIVVEHAVTGERQQCEAQKLLAEYVSGDLKTARQAEPSRRNAELAVSASPPPQRSEAARIETARRIDYLTQLERAGAFESTRARLQEEIRAISIKRCEPRPPHVTTVYRWHRRYKLLRRDAQAVMVAFERRGGRNQERLDTEVEAIIHDKIESVFLAARRCSAERVLNAVVVEIELRNETRERSAQLKMPSLRTLQRRIAALYAYERAVARYGKREADRRFANNLGARPVYRILELVEIDHSPIDCMVVDANRVVIGRPYCTVILDRKSRCVLACHLSLAGHGTEAVFQALYEAILPKTYLKDRYSDLSLQWDCFGWFEKAVVDNAQEFHANAVKLALSDLGIAVEFAASGDPNDKPHVERFLKTLNYSFIHSLPGTTLARVSDRIGFKSEDEACLTLEELDRLIHVWICNDYHRRPHGGLQGRSPMDVWQESAAEFPPELKMNASDLEVVLCQCTQSKVQNDGIDLNTFKFVSPELLALRRMLPEKAKVDVRWPTFDAGHIWVWNDMDKCYLRVPNRDQSLAGLTVEQAKTASKALASDGNTYRAVAGRSIDVVQGIINDAMRDKQLKTRRQGARFANMTSKRVRKAPAPLVADTDLLPVAKDDGQAVPWTFPADPIRPREAS